MSCCAPGAEAASLLHYSGEVPSEELRLASRDLGNGIMQTDINVPNAHCGACISAIETALNHLPEVISARLNLTIKKVSVNWRGDGPVPPIFETLKSVGYEASLSENDRDNDLELTRLLRATAVAAFAAMNIMLLSVSVWSGAEEATRNAFHMISAALALPAVFYSGRIFFASAWGALRAGRTNMDLPISVGILLTFLLSTYDAMTGGEHAYFDAVTSLLFFLLAGRTVDHMMRGKARDAVRALARMLPRGAIVLNDDGTRGFKDLQSLKVGETVLVSAGQRVPTDGTVLEGSGLIDLSIVTGESSPEPFEPGSRLLSGALNLTAPMTLRVDRRPKESFLEDMIQLMEAAEGNRAGFRRIADRAAAIYSPLVHTIAFMTFIGWFVASQDWHHSLTLAIAVLIITCPCALGLAVPMVQAAAARRLFSMGVTIKDGSALERLAEIDHVVLDKTGTLTNGQLRVASHTLSRSNLTKACALARLSNHPASLAVSRLGNHDNVQVTQALEVPGNGIQGVIDGRLWRLGRYSWAVDEGSARNSSGLWLSLNGTEVGCFELRDTLREGAGAAVAALRNLNLNVEVVSGDTDEETQRIASLLGISEIRGNQRPQDKVSRLEVLRQKQMKVLMVGDGLNDAPALGAANVSMAPSTAADVGRNAADFVFLGSSLDRVPKAVSIARKSMKLVRQNIAISIIYNILALPLAVLGYVTPLVAAVAMSASSIVVVANSLRVLQEVPGDTHLCTKGAACTTAV